MLTKLSRYMALAAICGTLGLIGSPSARAQAGMNVQGNISAQGAVSGAAISSLGDIKTGGGYANANAVTIRDPKDSNRLVGRLTPYFYNESAVPPLYETYRDAYGNDHDGRALILQSSGNYSVFITNNGNTDEPGSPLGGYQGIAVDSQGNVGIGSVANLNIYSPFQLGEVEPITFHNGGSTKKIQFNAYTGLDINSNYCDYYITNQVMAGISNYRTASPAADITMDYVNQRLSFFVAPKGPMSGQVTNLKDAISISANGDLGTLGNVGIGMKSFAVPQEALDVDGKLAFRNLVGDTNGHPVGVIGGRIWAEKGGIWIENASETGNQLTTHADPRSVDPQAVSSFGDPDVTLPYSFRHENALIGKGTIVDTAKMVQYVEKKMKAELGEQAGKLVYEYDLPANKRKTLDEYEVDRAMEELASRPPIKVDVGADGAIPAEALEEVDETIDQGKEITVQEKTLDLKARKIMAVEKKKKVRTKVKTGRRVTQLKANWQFSDGVLYRQPTVDDMDLSAMARRHPNLPDWVMSRIQQGRKTGQTVSALVEEIKKRLADVKSQSDYQSASSAESGVK